MNFCKRGKTWRQVSAKLRSWFSCAAIVATFTAALALPTFAEYTCELSFPHAPATALENFSVLVRISSTAPDGFDYADCPTVIFMR